jgi:transposase
MASSRACKVWACPAPEDLRKGFEGLAHLVRWQLGKELLDGDCFLFCSRTRTSAKVLLYDGTGLAIYCKRLERGRFACLWKGPLGHGPTQQPALPVVDLPHELDEADKVCNACGGELKPMGDQFETAEEIDVVARSFRIVRHKRQKYSRKCGACVDTALGPPKLILGGRYSTQFAVAVAVDKYQFHMPLSRQTTEMADQGLTVSVSTLWDQIAALATHLQSCYLALHKHILTARVVGTDETRWPLLDNENKNWWAWSVCCTTGVRYCIAKSRAHTEALELLRDFNGKVVCDAYTGYDALINVRQRNGKPLTLAHCWDHVQRKYFEAKDNNPPANEALRLIGKLYEIEARAAVAHPPGSDQWRDHQLLLRQTESAAVLEEIWAWQRTVSPLPTSGLGRAVKYMDKIRAELSLFVTDPDIPLDNNASERGMRALAVGRKNHYGSKSLRGTEVAALFYSLIETCKLVGVEPEKYLKAAALANIENAGTVILPHEMVGR